MFIGNQHLVKDFKVSKNERLLMAIFLKSQVVNSVLPCHLLISWKPVLDQTKMLSH